MTDDALNELCRAMLRALDENADLRGLVLDLAYNLPIDDRQRALLEAVDDGRWSR